VACSFPEPLDLAPRIVFGFVADATPEPMGIHGVGQMSGVTDQILEWFLIHQQRAIFFSLLSRRNAGEENVAGNGHELSHADPSIVNAPEDNGLSMFLP
jgi:hypothetical protein